MIVGRAARTVRRRVAATPVVPVIPLTATALMVSEGFRRIDIQVLLLTRLTLVASNAYVD